MKDEEEEEGDLKMIYVASRVACSKPQQQFSNVKSNSSTGCLKEFRTGRYRQQPAGSKLWGTQYKLSNKDVCVKICQSKTQKNLTDDKK